MSNRFAQAHILTGRSLIRMPGVCDLRANAGLWRDLWNRQRAELLPAWLTANPGRRPPVWWEFDAPPGLDRPDSDEVSALHRAGLLGADELEAIRAGTLELVAFNRGRSWEMTPAGYYKSNFAPPGPLEVFAARHGLISPDDAAVLGLTP